MKILGVIPARGGSKGVPNKNITDICGKPLLAYTAEAALTAKSLDRVVLSTDSQEIAAVGGDFGLEVPFLRSEELARDDTPTIDVLIDLLNKLDPECKYQAVCLLQPTSPLRTSKIIDSACDMFIEEEADTLLSVLPIPAHHHPDWALVEKDGVVKWHSGCSQPISRRQLLSPAYHREGSIYVSRAPLIRDHHTLYGEKISLLEIDPDESVNIDSMADLQRARQLIRERM